MQEVGISDTFIKKIIQKQMLPLKTSILKKKAATYYHKIGGKTAMKELIPILYENVLNDSELKVFFKGLDMKI